MLSEQAHIFVEENEWGEVYACGFCGRQQEVSHGGDLPECSCPTAVEMRGVLNEE